MENKVIREELKTLLHLLKQEKNEDLSQYRLKMAGTSLVERRRQGVCWYPVQLEKTQFDTGERLLVKVSRPIEHKEAHLFQSGKLVNLFSNEGSNNEEDESVNAVVNYVREHEMMITLNSHDFPDWIHDGKLGIQLLFDENSYKEMEKTLHYIIDTGEQRINEIGQILLGEKVAEFEHNSQSQITYLNQSQNDALNLVMNAKDLAIVHGPPGTGKTTTLVEAIAEVLKFENQVLVCAPSNAAVDLLVEKLSEKSINVLRIGHPARVTLEILSTTMDARIAHHKNFKELKLMRRQIDEYRKMGRKFKRNFGPAEREQRRLLLSEASKLKDEADQLAFYISRDIISKAQVIASTLVGANNSVLAGIKYKTVFIDEAAQAIEPACWIPIIKAERVIFAGDHQQLPPTIKSQEAARKGLEITLFEKAIKRNKADVMLREQYRMNSIIMNFSSRIFYNNSLIANENVANWKIFDDDLALEFIDTAGCGFFEQVDNETRSSYNPEEAELLIKHLSFYLSDLELMNILHEVQNIGIISPYKAQTILLAETIEINKPFKTEIDAIIAVNTVDSFQGQERDIIYISLVRSNERGEIGFLSDIRRMNVAMTRARKKLVIVGDSSTIAKHPFYNQLLDYVNETNSYRSAYELLY
jgi:ATP-dependent RNA/DNA helicase IGHMBP2